MAAILKPIQPEQVQINLPTRPPAETWVQPASRQSILLAKEILGEVARIIPPDGGYFNLGNPADIQEAILNVITRHPCAKRSSWKPWRTPPLARRKKRSIRWRPAGKPRW